MTSARVIARIAREEIEVLFGQFNMASKFFRSDLAYLLTGYFTGINPPAAKTKNLGELQKRPTHHMTHIKKPKLLRCPPRCVACR